MQMAQMNYRLAKIETLFMTTNPLYSFLSSSLVKDVARYGGQVSGLSPSRYSPSCVSASPRRSEAEMSEPGHVRTAGAIGVPGGTGLPVDARARGGCSPGRSRLASLSPLHRGLQHTRAPGQVRQETGGTMPGKARVPR
jgi:hypothetical protein